MSRIGKKPISIPEGVEVEIEGRKISVKGPKGQLSFEIRPEIEVEIHPVKSRQAGAAEPQFNGVKEKEILVSPLKENLEAGSLKAKEARAYWGLTRALIANMVKGVVEGYEKKLEIVGVGYRARVEEGKLVLEVGFSHPVEIKIPENIQVSVEKNIITVSGFDKHLVGQLAARIRSVRKPEPYKGKGIKYQDETIRRKAGKKAVSTAG